MKPLLLSMHAFGTFADETRIDFTVPDRDGLFLIHGKTGSGKTTVLDAMTFALYGTSSPGTNSAEERRPGEFRSQFAEPRTPTSVSLEFEVHSGRYRIVRQMKPVGDDGKLSSKVSLTRIDSAGRELDAPITAMNEVKRAVERIVGLSAEQFGKIVILPQGAFQRLLVANSNTKQTILETLFQTSLYARITGRLQELMRKERSRFEALGGQLDIILAKHGATKPEELGVLRIAVAADVQQLSDRESRCEETHKHVMSELNKGELLERTFADLKSAREQLTTHLSGEEKIRGLVSSLETARKASPLRGRIEEWRRVEEQIGVLDAVLAREQKELAGATAHKEQCEKALSDAVATKPEIDLLRVRIDALQRAVPVAKRIADNVAKRLSLRGSYTAHQKKAKYCDEEALRLGTELKELDRNLTEQQASADRVAIVETEYSRLTDLSKTHGDFIALKERMPSMGARVDTQQQVVHDAENRLAASRRELERIDREWRGHQAFAFSSSLHEGEPCPVCGSVDHPRPAVPASGVTTSEDRERAETRFHRCEEDVRRLTAEREAGAHEHAQVEAKCEALLPGLGQLAGMSIPDVRLLLERSKQERENVRAAVASVKKLREEKETATKRLLDIQKRRESAGAELLSVEQEGKTLTEQIDREQSELPDGVTDATSIPGILMHENQRLEGLARSLSCADEMEQKAREAVVAKESHISGIQQQLVSLRRNTGERKLSLERDCSNAGFASIDEIERSGVNDERLVELDASIRMWEGRRRDLEGQEKALARNVEGCEQPDIALLREDEQRASEQVESSRNLRTQKSLELHALTSSLHAIETIEHAKGELRDALAWTEDLAEAASGNNPLKLTFHIYVLSVFLDEILVQANLRLRTMSAGRYQLVRRVEPGDRRRIAGLDLNVHDSYSGDERSVSTLSGGEQFYTSLALALGLAEATLQRSGGIRLDALFIDEGFGSLDPETLDTAIQVLTELKNDGRLVGIISHVEELRERIPVRLEIVRGARGSTTRWHM